MNIKEYNNIKEQISEYESRIQELKDRIKDCEPEIDEDEIIKTVANCNIAEVSMYSVSYKKQLELGDIVYGYLVDFNDPMNPRVIPKYPFRVIGFTTGIHLLGLKPLGECTFEKSSTYRWDVYFAKFSSFMPNRQMFAERHTSKIPDSETLFGELGFKDVGVNELLSIGEYYWISTEKIVSRGPLITNKGGYIKANYESEKNAVVPYTIINDCVAYE